MTCRHRERDPKCIECLRAELEGSEAALHEARETNRRLNRRVQQLEVAKGAPDKHDMALTLFDGGVAIARGSIVHADARVAEARARAEAAEAQVVKLLEELKSRG